jgi:hypothetical protein
MLAAAREHFPGVRCVSLFAAMPCGMSLAML